MVAEHLTVVRRENDKTVIELVRKLNDAPDLIVDEVDHAIIGSASTLHLLFV